MINFRFHLVSLVAVFLALGVGVAMGASFIDRATVDTMRDRVDQLEQRYRDRGTEIDDLRDELRVLDETSEEMVAEGSPWIDGRLEDRNIVAIAPVSTQDAVLEEAWGPLVAAGANRSGTIRPTDAFDLGEPGHVEAARELLEMTAGSDAALRAQLLERAADALAVLAAPRGSGTAANDPDIVGPTTAPTTPETTTTETATTEPDQTETATTEPGQTEPGQAEDDSEVPSAVELADARRFIESLADAGFLDIDVGGAPGDASFPDVDEARYVTVFGADPAAAGVETALALTSSLAEEAPGTVTAAEMTARRSAGDLGDDGEVPGVVLVPLRYEDDSGRLSTVDRVGATLGQLALVLAVEEQYSGEVGHYGVGEGTSGLFPEPVPQ